MMAPAGSTGGRKEDGGRVAESGTQGEKRRGQGRFRDGIWGSRRAMCASTVLWLVSSLDTDVDEFWRAGARSRQCWVCHEGQELW